MFTMREYKRPENIDQAYELLMAKKANCLLAGNHFLKLGRKAIATGIDLQDLELSYIEEEGAFIKIGASTTLRAIEESERLEKYYGDVFRLAFSGIVGTQFRNTATLGAAVHARYGFSDPCLVLLALDAKVRLYGQEPLTMEAYMKAPLKKDMVLEVIIPIKNQKISYKGYRRSATDISVLNVCVAYEAGKTPRIAVGARPARAMLANHAMESFNGDVEATVNKVRAEVTLGSNMRASAEYRGTLLETLAYRALEEVV